MIRIASILCPVDFSDHSRRALDHAVALARWYKAPVTVLHAYPTETLRHPPGFPATEPIVLPQLDLARLEQELRQFVAAESAAGVEIVPVLKPGAADDVILQQAGLTRPDLLVMGTHGRSGFHRLLLGSVAERVLRHAPCPVLTVPRLAPDAVPAATVLFKSILCAVDFSSCSLHALRYAVSMAEEADARLVVAHALGQELEEAAVVMSPYRTDAGIVMAEHRRRAADLARERLLAAVPADARTYCEVEAVVAAGHPAPEILRLAQEKSADLIVLGVQGSGALERLVFGSTTQDVVRGAACPVLTIPAES